MIANMLGARRPGGGSGGTVPLGSLLIPYDSGLSLFHPGEAAAAGL